MRDTHYEIAKLINDAIIGHRDNLCKIMLRDHWLFGWLRKNNDIQRMKGIIEGLESAKWLIRGHEEEKEKEEEHIRSLAHRRPSLAP